MIGSEVLKVGKLGIEELANKDVVPSVIIVVGSLVRHGVKYVNLELWSVVSSKTPLQFRALSMQIKTEPLRCLFGKLVLPSSVYLCL